MDLSEIKEMLPNLMSSYDEIALKVGQKRGKPISSKTVQTFFHGTARVSPETELLIRAAAIEIIEKFTAEAIKRIEKFRTAKTV